MAAGHRVMSQTLGSMELSFTIVLGAAGVIPAAGAGIVDNDGFDSSAPITSVGAGVYTVKLEQGWLRLLPGCVIDVKQAAAYSAAAACRANYIVDNVGASIPTVTFTIVNSAGAATQPAIGDKLSVFLRVKR